MIFYYLKFYLKKNTLYVTFPSITIAVEGVGVVVRKERNCEREP